MRNQRQLLVLLFGLIQIVTGQNAWINEIHYDNSGTDANEGIEIIIENPGSYTLANFKLTLYNGNGGGKYGTHALDTFTEGSISNGFTIFYKMISGIQNGAPDGMALSYNGNLISGQFLSYEGSFAATDGDANGVSSTNIGVSEGSTTSTESLQLTGDGTQYSDFSWMPNLAQTWGTQNDGGDQSLPVELSSWTASSTKGVVILNWITESEIENQGFIIERRRNLESSSQELASFINDETLLGHGSSTARNSYTYKDNQVEVGQTYIYQLSDVDYSGKITKHSEISVTVKAAEQNLKSTELTLHTAYPNPFNPEITVSFTKTDKTLRATSLQVFDVNGRFVETLYAGITEPGTYTETWDGGTAASGVYFLRLASSSEIQIQRVTLLR